MFDPTLAKFEGAFQYEKAWSQALIDQVELSIHRFKSYLESQDAIRNEEISKFNKAWMKRALDLIPEGLLGRFQADVRLLFAEVFTSYARAMRQSILEYILRSPEERKRLHIVMLPRPVPPASVRQALSGGFSTAAFAGCHQRRAEAELALKLRLLTNSVVASALQGWFRDFRSFNLFELRDLT